MSPIEHPDAKLVIRSLSATSLELELHTSDGVTFAPFGPIQLEREPDKFFKGLFSEIQGLSVRYRTSQGAHRELDDLGAELAKRLFPLELGRHLPRPQLIRRTAPRPATTRVPHELRDALPLRNKLEVEALFQEARGNPTAVMEAFKTLWATSARDPESGILLAEAQVTAGDTDSALATLAELRDLSLSTLQKGEADLLEAKAYLDLGDLETARDAADRAVRRGEQVGARHFEARARLDQAEAFERSEAYEEAQETLEAAKRLFELEPKSRTGVWEAFNRLAFLLYWKGGAEAARGKFAEYREEYQRRGDRLGAAMAQGNLGLVLTDLGEYRQAEVLLEEVRPYFEDYGLPSEVATVANSLGICRQFRGKLKEAKASYGKALTIFDKLGRRGDVAKTRTNLGEVAYLEGDLAEARNLHERALATNRELGDTSGEAYDLHRLGIVHTAAGNFEDARQALENARALPSEDSALATLALAELELAVKNFARARELATQAEQGFWYLGMDDSGALALILQAQVLLASEPAGFEKAWDLGQRARNHLESSENRQAQVAIAALEARLALHEGDVDVLRATSGKLEQFVADTREVPYSFKLRLVRAEVEKALRRPEQARGILRELAAQAGDRGFEPIARRARESSG